MARGAQLQAAAAGVCAAGAALATTVVAHAAAMDVPSLVAVVDQALLRQAPGSVSRTAIDAVGRSDKPLLVLGTVLVALSAGAGIGVAARKRPPLGPLAFGLFALVGAASAASLHGVSTVATGFGAGAGALVGTMCLHWLLRSLHRSEARQPAPQGAPSSRREFLRAGSVVAGGTAVALIGASRLRVRPTPVVELPPAATTAAAATTAEVTVPGITPLVTSNATFYKIDEALVAPFVDVKSWRLKVSGMVDHPFELTFDDLLAEPLIERHVTLSCVSNEVGGPLVGNALWRGVSLKALLERAGVQSGASQVVGRSVDHFTVGFPTEVALDGRDAMVAIGMNGTSLPRKHGFPARLVVPGLYGYVSATKWLKEIELTTWDAFDAYWVDRGWAKSGPIKVESRIDVPRDFSLTHPGQKTLAGVAWAPHMGISAVDIRVDHGDWQPADLGRSLGDDAWRQWSAGWMATPGQHVIEVRATTPTGVVQTEERHATFPNGASGLHGIIVRVA